MESDHIAPSRSPVDREDYRELPFPALQPGIFRNVPTAVTVPQQIYYSERSNPPPMTPPTNRQVGEQMKMVTDAREALKGRATPATAAEKRHQQALKTAFKIRKDKTYSVPDAAVVRVAEDPFHAPPVVQGRSAMRAPEAVMMVKRGRVLDGVADQRRYFGEPIPVSAASFGSNDEGLEPTEKVKPKTRVPGSSAKGMFLSSEDEEQQVVKRVLKKHKRMINDSDDDTVSMSEEEEPLMARVPRRRLLEVANSVKENVKKPEPKPVVSSFVSPTPFKHSTPKPTSGSRFSKAHHAANRDPAIKQEPASSSSSLSSPPDSDSSYWNTPYASQKHSTKPAPKSNPKRKPKSNQRHSVPASAPKAHTYTYNTPTSTTPSLDEHALAIQQYANMRPQSNSPSVITSAYHNGSRTTLLPLPRVVTRVKEEEKE